MRTGIRVSLAAAAALVVGLSGSASATHGGIHPAFKESRTYFHCAGGDTAKVQNLNSPSPFDTTAPARSVADGAGCGTADPGFLIHTTPSGGQVDSAFSGVSTGNLKNMTVEMYLLGNYNYGPVFGEIDLDLWLVIDGEEYLTYPTENTPQVTPPLVETNDGATQKVEFTIMGLGSATTNPDGSVITSGLATEDGDGTSEREIQLTVRAHFADTASVWVFDTTEVPGGITFNDPTPAPTRISV